MADKVIVLRSARKEVDERSFRIKYAELLNPSQLAAVTHRDGPILVIAGAGSGKTRTLIYRVARLIESGVPPGAILLLTFTRRASQEMLRRVEHLVGDRTRAVAGGTFHSFANLTLRQFGSAIGLKPNFTILDRSDMEDVVNLLRTRMGLGSRDRRFPKKGTITEVISMARNKRRELGEEIEFDFPHLVEHREDLVRLAAAYDAYKRERGLLDYDDLLYRLAELLEQHDNVRRRLSDTYRYIMIDEYQDTNLIQAELVRLLAATHRNVMAVGDDAQSIYSFRGANFRNIMDFPEIFAGARVVKLEQNYRSLQGILDVANEVISRAGDKYTKVLAAERRGEFRPLLIRAQDEHMQSRFVAERILELREEGVELGEIAVLFRSGFHSFDLELELQRRDIPFIKRGGFKFIETAHIKDVLAHLRVIVNPADAVSWLRALMLVPGVGHRRAERLIEEIVAAPEPERALVQAAESIGAGARSGGGPGSSAGGTAAAAARLAALLAGLRRDRGASRRSACAHARVLSAADARELSGRLSEARARPRTFPDHHRALPQSRIDAGRRGARAAQRLARRRARGRARRGLPDAQHDPLGQGAGVARGVSDLGGGRTFSRPAERRRGGIGRGAPPDVRRQHARARRTVHLVSYLHVRPRDGLHARARVAVSGRRFGRSAADSVAPGV